MAKNVVEIIVKAKNEFKDGIRAPITDLKSLQDVAEKTGPVFKLAAGAAVAALAVLAKKSIDTADAMYQMGQRTGESVEFLSGMKYAAEQSDTSVESLQKGMKGLASSMNEAINGGQEQQQLFKDLDVEYKNADGSLRKTGDVLLDVAAKFKDSADGAGKNTAAVKLFGKAGEDLIPMLNEGKDGLQGMQLEAAALGQVFSGQTARAAADFNDNIDKSLAGVDGLVNAFTAGLVPALADTSGRLADAAKEGQGLHGFLKATGEVVGSLGGQLFALGRTVAGVFQLIGTGAAAAAVALGELATGNLAGAKAAIAAFGQDAGKTLDGIGEAWYAAFDPAVPQASAEAANKASDEIRLTSQKNTEAIRKAEEKAAADARSLLKELEDEHAKTTDSKIANIYRERDAQLQAINEAALGDEERQRALQLLLDTTSGKVRAALDEENAKDAQVKSEEMTRAQALTEAKLEMARTVAELEAQYRLDGLEGLEYDMEAAQVAHDERLAEIDELELKGMDSAKADELRAKSTSKRDGDLHRARLKQVNEIFNLQNSLAAGLLAAEKVLEDKRISGSKKAEKAIKALWVTFRDSVKAAMLAYTAQKTAQVVIDLALAKLEALGLAKIWAPAATAATIATAGAAAAGAPGAIAGSIAASTAVTYGATSAAHGGLEYVPAEQTFLLQKGERVIQPKQNVQLQEFLDRQGGGSAAGPREIVLHLNNREVGRALLDMSLDGQLQISAKAVKAGS